MIWSPWEESINDGKGLTADLRPRGNLSRVISPLTWPAHT